VWSLDGPRALLHLHGGGGMRRRYEEFPLTSRQCEIMRWASEGKTQLEIAEILAISAKTVKTHYADILAKLDVHSMTQAVAEGFRKGILGI
jgi:DNA-binding CsgD family transcriptional regulator